MLQFVILFFVPVFHLNKRFRSHMKTVLTSTIKDSPNVKAYTGFVGSWFDIPVIYFSVYACDRSDQSLANKSVLFLCVITPGFIPLVRFIFFPLRLNTQLPSAKSGLCNDFSEAVELSDLDPSV